MTSRPSPETTPENSSKGNLAKPPKADHGPILMTALMFLGVAWLISTENPLVMGRSFLREQIIRRQARPLVEPVPLAMDGGDPYVRALMRTISAAESNTAEPYNTLYGGSYISDLSQHPDICIRIEAGPNLGDCTTAAGRYQFLTTTWASRAERYHPHSADWYAWWSDYSFEPTFQDEVVYRWLVDDVEWGVHIPTLLRENRLNEVLDLLSGTWTSLGYGIEDNVVTPYLGQIYQIMLDEELSQY